MTLSYHVPLRTGIFITILCILSHTATAQPSMEAATGSLKTEQHNFLHYIINTAAVQPDVAQRLSHFIKADCDSLQKAITGSRSLSKDEKIRGIQSLVYFMSNARENLTGSKTDYYDIPAALESYKALLNALMYHKPYDDIIRPLSPKRTFLMANSFRNFPEFDRLNDIATYKNVLQSPENIFKFIETTNDFRFKDSLLLFLAANEPIRLSNYIKRSNSALVTYIRSNEDPYISQIVQLSENRNATELLPFISMITDSKISTEEILQKRLDVTKYFQLMVNTLIEAINEGESTEFLNALRAGIREKSLKFYVNRINELHDASNTVRFAAVKDLRPIDLYYVITTSGEELYTSSYLGLYRKLMDFCKKSSTDSLFHLVKYDDFRTFIRMAANYNTLSDFFSCLPEGTTKELMRRYISDIEADTYTGVEKAMDVADSFSGLAGDTVLSDLVHSELLMNFDRNGAEENLFGTRIYDILLQVYNIVKNPNQENAIKEQLGEYGRLDRKRLQNSKGEVVELVMFYGDADGVASFNSFSSMYKDSSKWETFQNDRWIRIRSKGEKPFVIYANLPLDNEKEYDLRAQESLVNFLNQQGIVYTILVHRGHSYHLKYTLRKLHPGVKLAVLGSCGGYNNILSVANISPDAQIIVSKKIGSMLVNDPLLEVINSTLEEKNDLVWGFIWEKLTERFSKDAFTLNLFNEYLPPTKNISLFVLKLFNFTDDPTRVVTR